MNAIVSSLILSMSLFIKATTNSRKISFLTLFVPLFDPITGTNGIGKLTQGLALVVTRLLGTQYPFIVSIPTMQGLVLVWKTIIVRRRARLFDLLQTSHFLLVERREFLRKNLCKTKVAMVSEIQIMVLHTAVLKTQIIVPC